MRVLILIFICTLTGACGGPSTGPEEQLRQWVADAEAHAENKERRALMDMISAAYADARGNDVESVDNMLRLYFLRMQNISLLSTIDEIIVNADSAAEIELTVAMLGTRDSALGLDADAYRFHLELEHNGDEWLLIGASYGELGGDMH